MVIKKSIITALFIVFSFISHAQILTDSTIKEVINTDTILRIKNINPYFTLHVDSTLSYDFEINKEDPSKFYWYLKNSPVGVKINRETGLLTFKADKSFFLSGKLKYDYEYKVKIGIQNLNNPLEHIDTSFSLLFFNTEIIPSVIKPTVTNVVYADEGDTINFRLQCDNGSFPIDEITYFSNYPAKSLTSVTKCNDEYTWFIPFDFIKDSDKEKIKMLELFFVGITKFNIRDTTIIKIYVKDNINYPQRVIEFEELRKQVTNYIVQLKSSFKLTDEKIKKTKKNRTAFDLGSAATGLGGTVFSSLPNTDQKTVGKILPSIGVALVPVKEATSPNVTSDQNTALLIRNSIKRLEYLLKDNPLVGDRDPDILQKDKKIKDEIKQMQIQLIDIPFSDEKLNSKQLDEYFNNPKVNKKYRVKKK
jgi:hypothetical protein